MSRLSQLNCSRWNITEHSFDDDTPLGRKPFTNIIATLDPHVSKRLVLAAHYDSKLLPKKQFLAATDSALPVALLLDLALTLDEKLQERDVIFVCKCVCTVPSSLSTTHCLCVCTFPSS